MRQQIRSVLQKLGLYGLMHRVREGMREREQFQAMRRFYGQFVRPGDLCFDVGANMGSRTEVFLALGAKVVAVEPQADCIQQLRTRYAKRDRVTLFQGGLAEQEGQMEIYISQPNPTSSMSKAWIERLKSRAGWEGHRWYKAEIVPVTTLDALIAQHGEPVFVKIDVEGFELPVLRGLSRPVRALSFEYSPEMLETAWECIAYLQKLGDYEFNASYKESMAMMLPNWSDAQAVQQAVRDFPIKNRSGDVYARLARTRGS